MRHLLGGLGVLDRQRLAVIEHVEKERRLRALAPLSPPQVLVVGRGRAVPAFLVLFVQRNLARRRIHQTGQVLGDER